MAVIPERAGLLHLEAVLERFAWRDTRVTQPWHAIHVGRQDHAVPVDRGGYRHAVGDIERHRVAFAPVQRRCRHLTVDDSADGRLAGEVDRRLGDIEVEGRAAQDRRGAAQTRAPRMDLPGDARARNQPGQHAAQRQTAHETASRRVGQNGRISG
jgi:hypothetical protein